MEFISLKTIKQRVYIRHETLHERNMNFTNPVKKMGEMKWKNWNWKIGSRRGEMEDHAPLLPIPTPPSTSQHLHLSQQLVGLKKSIVVARLQDHEQMFGGTT